MTRQRLIQAIHIPVADNVGDYNDDEDLLESSGFYEPFLRTDAIENRSESSGILSSTTDENDIYIGPNSNNSNYLLISAYSMLLVMFTSIKLYFC